MVAEERYGEGIGCHIIGHGASDLIAELGLALTLEATFREIGKTVHAHPTLPEAIREAALMLGGEAVVVGVCHDLRPDDWIFPLHRDLGAFLVKGADPNRLMAQIFGRRDGFSKGKDSFLHGGDFSRCIFGSTSMLGAPLPVAVGTAYKFKIGKEDRVAIAFFGEGASSRGDVHEAMNFAGIYKLPVVFLCENNFYAYSTPNELQFAVEDVADRAVGYGFKGEVCPGNALHSVMKAARKAIARARSGGGATLP